MSATKVNLSEYTGMNYAMQAALENKVPDLIIVGDSRLAIQQCMGVIACNEDSLHVMLARHNALVAEFNSVRSLHVIRCYNGAEDTLATEALKGKSGHMVEDPGRLNELQKLNRIQERLLVEDPSSKVKKEPPTITITTRSRTRRGRFTEQLNREQRGTPSRARNHQDKYDHYQSCSGEQTGRMNSRRPPDDSRLDEYQSTRQKRLGADNRRVLKTSPR